MAERVHPHDPPQTAPSDEESKTPRPNPPTSPEKPVPPPPAPRGTYVIQIPKDQIYRVPPPENADRYKHLSRRNHRRGCRCCCCFCCALLILIFLLGVTAAVFYLVFRPESPDYSIESVSIKSLNLTSPSTPVSPEFDITVRANNPNNKIGIYYEKDSSVTVYYQDVSLANGVLPRFYQPTNNVTVFETALKGSGIELTRSVRNEMVAAARANSVPLRVNVRVPVKIKVGSVKTWTIKVKVNCEVTVNRLTAAARILTKNCNYGVDLW